MSTSVIDIISNPAILSLTAGLCWGLYSTLLIPALFTDIISLYLIFIIGFKGGMCLGVTHACTPPLIGLTIIGCIMGFIQPFIYFHVLKRISNLDRQTAIVVASQYGSISIITFITAITFLQQQHTFYDTFMSAVAGIMEIPAIFSGLMLLRTTHKNGKRLLNAFIETSYDIVTSKKISFIFIGFFVGYLFKHHPTHIIPSILLWPFTIALILFMVDIGTKIALQRTHIHQFSWKIIGFGIGAPIASGTLGMAISYLLHISLGSALLFTMLLASASYIAVPAIMYVQAPQAKEVIYLPLALGITLPFNLLIGIPFFYNILTFLWQ